MAFAAGGTTVRANSATAWLPSLIIRHTRRRPIWPGWGNVALESTSAPTQTSEGDHHVHLVIVAFASTALVGSMGCGSDTTDTPGTPASGGSTGTPAAGGSAGTLVVSGG